MAATGAAEGFETASRVTRQPVAVRPGSQKRKKTAASTPSRRAAEQMGIRIRKARQELRISLSALAGNDFSRSFINQVELGKARPSVRNLQIIAERLNRPIEYFLQDDELSRTAVELALTEAETRLRRGDGPGARELVAKLSDRSHLPQELRVRVDLIQAEAWIRQGAAEEAVPILQRAIAVCEARKWNSLLAEVYDRMGSAQYLLRRAMEAARWFDKAFATYETCRITDPLLKARILGHRANLHYIGGHPQEAITAYQGAIAEAGHVMDMQGLAGIYEGLAMSFQKAGQPAQSLTYAQRSLRLYETLQDIRMSAQLRNNMACILMEQGSTEQAEKLFLEGAEQLRRAGDTDLLPHLLFGAAEAALEHGDLSGAASRLSGAAAAAAKSKDPIAQLGVERISGRLAHATGDIAAAREHFEKALDIASKANSAHDRTRVAYDYAKVLEASGAHQEAARRYREALESGRSAAQR
jgi:HTH-type transcriptional regulator, quorum sensing regulator NprR